MKSTVSTDHFNKQIYTRALCTKCTTLPTFLGMIYSWQILSSLWPTQNTRKVAKKRRERMIGELNSKNQMKKGVPLLPGLR